MQYSPDTAAQLAAQEAAEPDVRLWALDRDQALAEWGTLERFLKIACDATCARMQVEDVREYVAAGNVWIFAVVDFAARRVLGVVGTEVAEYPRQRVFSVVLAGADPAQPVSAAGWQSVWRELCQIAGRAGCSQIEITGRVGWGRVLGLEETTRTFVKAIRKREANDG